MKSTEDNKPNSQIDRVPSHPQIQHCNIGYVDGQTYTEADVRKTQSSILQVGSRPVRSFFRLQDPSHPLKPITSLFPSRGNTARVSTRESNTLTPMASLPSRQQDNGVAGSYDPSLRSIFLSTHNYFRLDGLVFQIFQQTSKSEALIVRSWITYQR
jgi:hypothetical protein